MFTLISTLALFFAILCMAALAIVDMKMRLLPNIQVLCLAFFAYLFHFTTAYAFETPFNIALGSVLGGGALFIIRFIANRYYGHDTLGLGDVKLMAAAGLWLGPHDVFLALGLGAGFGVLHGLVEMALMRINRTPTGPVSSYSIPAGPGFIAGTAVAASFKLQTYLTGLF